MTHTTTDAAEARALPQPSVKATNLALTATPADFPIDSYGLALWLDRAFATAEAASGAGEREELAAFGASEAAGYQYPGANQAAERAAFCAGAAHSASIPPATDPAIPDGWKLLVPVEPTEAMIAAWESASPAAGWDALQDMSDEDANRALVRAEWSAMLAAAPTIPATGEML